MNQNKLAYLPSFALVNNDKKNNDNNINIIDNNEINNDSIKSMKFIIQENQIEEIRDFAKSF